MGAARSVYYQEPENVSCYTVGPGRIALYDVPVHWITHGRNGGGARESAQPKDDPLSAAIRARKRCTDAAGWLWLRSRGHYITDNHGRSSYFRQGFWTLTCPEPVPEEQARAALSLFWNWARKLDVDSYLWVAELTERGRVHFHAIVNEWMNIDEARAAWLRCLKREGCVSDALEELPLNAVTAGRAKGSESSRMYAAKYIGKAFGGKRAEQLQLRLDNELASVDTSPDHEARVAELRARLSEAMANVRAGARRWSATHDLNRRGPSLNAIEAATLMEGVRIEMDQLGGRWGKKHDHGQTFYFDLSKVTARRSPILHRMLKAASRDPA